MSSRTSGAWPTPAGSRTGYIIEVPRLNSRQSLVPAANYQALQTCPFPTLKPVTDQGKHVFLSYVSEDSGRVDELCTILEAAGIPYWRDRKDLWPGDQWRTVIRTAIQSGSLVFLACFSEQSRARAKSYQNEELNLAVEEMRQMPPGRP